MRKKVVIAFSIIAALGILFCLGSLVVLQLPAVSERVGWRMESLVSRLRRLINPPEEVVFIPAGANPSTPVLAAVSSVGCAFPSVTLYPASDISPTSDLSPATPSLSPSASAAPTPSPTSLPDRILLSGLVHEYQQFNNCGPANLAMALSFWGWQGDQRDTRQFLRPNLKVDDKNVMPEEMVAYVEQFTTLNAITRTGGNLDLLRSLIAAGFPVLIEAGHHPPDDWWMGHYLVVNGYDDSQQTFTVQDSLSNPNLPMSYTDLAGHWWRDFNYVYIVIFPPEREAEVIQIMGTRWDERFSYQLAAQYAIDELTILQERDQFFAAFNLGSSLVGVEDFTGAAQALRPGFSDLSDSHGRHAPLPADVVSDRALCRVLPDWLDTRM